MQLVMGAEYDCFVSCASWAVMRRCDGNESGVGVGVGVGQEPAVEVGVGVGTASPRLRNSGRGPESESESVWSLGPETESESDSAPPRLRNPAYYHSLKETVHLPKICIFY